MSTPCILFHVTGEMADNNKMRAKVYTITQYHTREHGQLWQLTSNTWQIIMSRVVREFGWPRSDLASSFDIQKCSLATLVADEVNSEVEVKADEWMKRSNWINMPRFHSQSFAMPRP